LLVSCVEIISPPISLAPRSCLARATHCGQHAESNGKCMRMYAPEDTPSQVFRIVSLD
jgi:hypothetical protein